jgi:hypothetical protein
LNQFINDGLIHYFHKETAEIIGRIHEIPFPESAFC